MININALPSPGQVFELYRRYYVQDETPENVMSSHWKKFSRKIQVCIAEDGNLTVFKGCGFVDLQPAHPLNKILNYLCNFSYFARLPNKKDLLFLAKKLMPFLKKAKFYFSYDCFRQLCALSVIRQHLKLKDKEGFDILLIGDGPGILSALLKNVYSNARVTLVDIGKVLFFQAVNLQNIYPECSHWLFDNSAKVKKSDFLYVPAEDAVKLKGISYKLAINMASMQEMNYKTINDYFRFMRQNLTKDNLFYCCNREQKMLPGGEVIEFLKYPWLKEDTNFIDEICPFYRYYFSAPPPFIHSFDGLFRHRLANLSISKGVLSGIN